MRRWKRILKVGMCVLIGALAIPILGPISMLPLSHPAHAQNLTVELDPEVRIFRGGLDDEEVEARVFTDSTDVKAHIVQAKNMFQKIGDGWKHGKWIPGLPDIKINPKTPEELWPQCIGSPQECRTPKGEAKAKQPPIQVATAPAGAKFVAHFRCQCSKSTDVGDNHGDVTIPYSSDISVQDAQQKAWNEYKSGIDLCQKYHQMPSSDTRMVQGSGGFVD